MSGLASGCSLCAAGAVGWVWVLRGSQRLGATTSKVVGLELVFAAARLEVSLTVPPKLETRP